MSLEGESDLPQTTPSVTTTSEMQADEVEPMTRTSRVSTFRNANSDNEVKAFSLLQSLQYETSDRLDTGAAVTAFDGYMLKDKHTATTDAVRWVLKYKPTRGTGTTALIGIRLSAVELELPSLIRVNGQALSPVPGAEAVYWDKNVKVNFNQENSIEFTTVSKTKLSNRRLRMNVDFATSLTPTYAQIINPHESSNVTHNVVVATSTLDTHLYEATVTEIEEPKSKTVEEPIPFTTIYQADETLQAGRQVVSQEGENGEQTVILSYTKDGQVILLKIVQNLRLPRRLFIKLSPLEQNQRLSSSLSLTQLSIRLMTAYLQRRKLSLLKGLQAR